MVWENGTGFFLPPILEIFEIQSPMCMANREGSKAGGLCFSLNPHPCLAYFQASFLWEEGHRYKSSKPKR